MYCTKSIYFVIIIKNNMKENISFCSFQFIKNSIHLYLNIIIVLKRTNKNMNLICSVKLLHYGLFIITILSQ